MPYNVNNNYILPPEYFARASNITIDLYRRESMGRNIIPVNPIGGGEGVQSWTWEYSDDMSEATLSWNKDVGNADQISYSRAQTNIPVLHKEFLLNSRDLATAQMNNFPMSTKNIEAATKQMVYAENRIIFDGHKRADGSYDMKGLYQLAGTTVDDHLAITTYGNTTLLVKAMLQELNDKEAYGRHNLVMNNMDYVDLTLSVNTAGNIREIDTVQRLLDGGSIISTYWQPKGTMMGTPAPEVGAVEMLITQDVSMDTVKEPKTKDIWGQLYEYFGIACYRPEQIVKFTNVN